MISAETLANVVNDSRNYLGGRDGARVFSVPVSEIPNQRCRGVIKLFQEPGLAHKELFFGTRMIAIGNRAPTMFGVGQYSGFPPGHFLYTPTGVLEGVLMEELSGFRFEELPSAQRRSAKDAFVVGVVNALNHGIMPRDSYWNSNVFYQETKDGLVACFFDFARWEQKRVPIGRGMAFLRKACDIRELPTEVYSQ